MRKHLLLIGSFALCACATIFNGTTDTLRFDSNVPGVRVSVDGRLLGETPLTVEMSRNFFGGKLFLAKFEKPGYVTQEFQLSREFNTIAILDISSTVISGGIDVLTGALMRFAPTDYHVQMLDERDTKEAFRRNLDLYRFALMNHAQLQRDLARRGGESLAAFAWLAADGDASVAAMIEERALASAPQLVTAARPHAFVAAFNGVLADDARLAGLQLR